MILSEKKAGILLHVTSLPSSYGIGDLGSACEEWLNFLMKTEQQYWQILPIHPVGFGESPYQSFSAFAGEELLLDPEWMREKGYLTSRELKNTPIFDDEVVDYQKVSEWKEKLFYQGFLRFRKESAANGFSQFCEQHKDWLDDYALFRAIKNKEEERPWHQWPEKLKKRDSQAIHQFSQENEELIQYYLFLQFCFFMQWQKMKKKYTEQNIKIVGDLPIFVAHDSADVWANSQLFDLKEDGTPRVVAGVPPDYFSVTGQRWGNPHYKWNEMKKNHYSWWSRRIEHLLTMVDIIRIDHFRGFEAYWEIPEEEITAKNGRWIKAPGDELFKELKKQYSNLPLIAEDLGIITPPVRALKKKFGLPGMKILQFSFYPGLKKRERPYEYEKNTFAYSGTHDNDTLAGWIQTEAQENKSIALRIKKQHRIDVYDNVEKTCWDLLEVLFSTNAGAVIVPMQDYLCLGSEARMNYPGTIANNWRWRVKKEAIADDVLAVKIKQLATKSNRLRKRN